MFTQSMTKHVVSRVNEEGGEGRGWELFLSRFLNSYIIDMSRVTQAIERPPPAPRRFVFQIKYFAQKVRYKYIFLVYDGLYFFAL